MRPPWRAGPTAHHGRQPVRSELLSARPLLAYYLGGTPLFFLLDAGLHFSVRASFFQDPWARFGYYLFCIACGAVCWFYPKRAPLVGVGESAVNITLLIVGFMVPILSMTDAVIADPAAPIVSPVTTQGIINFMIAGGMAWVAFQQRVGGLRGGQ